MLAPPYIAMEVTIIIKRCLIIRVEKVSDTFLTTSFYSHGFLQ